MSLHKMIDAIVRKGFWRLAVANAIALVQKDGQAPETVVFAILTPVVAVATFGRDRSVLARNEPLVMAIPRASFAEALLPRLSHGNALKARAAIEDCAPGSITLFVERSTGFEWKTVDRSTLPVVSAEAASALRINDDGSAGA